MNRIFLGLAVASGSLLVASFVVGLCAAGESGGGPGQAAHVWHDVHFLVGLLAVMTGALVHSVVFTYFLGTGRWVKEVVRVYQLPEWVYAQAVRNKRRAFPFEFAGMAFLAFTAWLGAGADQFAWPSLWHLAMAAVAMAFNFGAFAAEYASIVAQARLLVEVKDEADRMRAAQLAQAAASPEETHGSAAG